MSVLRLCILGSLLGCYIGYAIGKPSAQYYDLQPYTYQWPPSHYLPDSYYYYYPDYYYYPNYYPQPSQPELQKPNPEQCPPYEAQKLLQVYRVIRVIDLFRSPPKNPNKITSLDLLVEQLTKEALQEQLIEVVSHFDGYDEVAELERGSPKVDIFVDDIARLLLAIQRALNALNLDEHVEELHRHQYPRRHGCCKLHEALCGKLRQLRDLANALTLEQVEKELVYGIKAAVKQEVDSDALEDLEEELENRSLDLDEVDTNLPVIEDNREMKSKESQFEEATLDDLAIALEIYLQQQKMLEVQQQKSEKETESITSTTTVPPVSTTVEGSWFGNLFGKGDLSPDNRTAVEFEPTTDRSTQNAWVHKETVEKHDIEIDERFQAPPNGDPSSTVSAVTHSVPLWLVKTSEQPEKKESDSDFSTRQEEELLRELPESRQEAEEEAKTKTDAKMEHPHASEAVTEKANSQSTILKETLPSTLKTTSSKPAMKLFIKEQIFNVLKLLEDAEGFTELKERISNPDVDRLAESLSGDEAGIKWTDFLSALQNLVAEKQLHSGDKIRQVLENWKTGSKDQLDNGYFNRTYEAGYDIEARQLVDDEGAELSSIQEKKNIGEQAESVPEPTPKPFVDEVDNFFGGSYVSNNDTSIESLMLNMTKEQASSNTSSDAEDKSPRIINVDETEQVSTSTQILPTAEVANSGTLELGEESTEKLEDTTPQSPPLNETKSETLER